MTPIESMMSQLARARASMAATRGPLDISETALSSGFRQSAVIRGGGGTVGISAGHDAQPEKKKSAGVSPVVIAGGLALLAVGAFVVIRMRK